MGGIRGPAAGVGGGLRGEEGSLADGERVTSQRNRDIGGWYVPVEAQLDIPMEDFTS